MLSEEAACHRPAPPRWAVQTQKPPQSASVPSFLESVSQTDCKNESEPTHHYPGLTAACLTRQHGIKHRPFRAPRLTALQGLLCPFAECMES